MIVKEETLNMDKKLEALKEEGAMLRSQLESGDIPSIHQLIEMEASNESVGPE